MTTTIDTPSHRPLPDNIDDEHTFETAFYRVVSELLEASKENHTATQENMIVCH